MFNKYRVRRLASNVIIDAVRQIVFFGKEVGHGYNVDREYSIPEQWERITMASSSGWRIVLLNANKHFSAVAYFQDEEISYTEDLDLTNFLNESYTKVSQA